jgi:hypothetical protein
MKWAAPGGWTVEAVRMSSVTAPKRVTDPAAGDGEYLIVRHYGKTFAFAASPAEVAAAGVDLASLTPAH